MKQELTNGVSAHTCAQMMSGEISCWGKNDSGQIGNGTTLDVWAPLAIDMGAEVQSIATGSLHTCALTAATPKSVRHPSRNQSLTS